MIIGPEQTDGRISGDGIEQGEDYEIEDHLYSI